MHDPETFDATAKPAPRHWTTRRDGFILACCNRAMRDIGGGRITLTMPSGLQATLGQGGTVHADLTLRNFSVFWAALRRGSIGFAEAYMNNDCETRDLGNLFRFFIDNKTALADAGRGRFKVRIPDTLLHRLRRNTRSGSRRNIRAHYDLGNAFYAPWLDTSMTYSSAVYAAPNVTLEAAQEEKYARIFAALDLKPGMRLLEIGCGWGALAERAAKLGAHVTAITISTEQLEFARRRIAAAGLQDRVDLRFCDYRDVTGTFDRIASIEMIEAVGEEHWPDYFGTVSRCLAPGGHAVIQAITIAEDIFENYRRKADFIQRYIFPGGMLLTPVKLEAGAQQVRLDFASLETFGQSYAKTLVEWHNRFEAAWPHLQTLGFNDRFRRMWLYYLSYCEAGFERGTVDVGLYRFKKS
jgi:cyclopropane-fatty-acyl-phospholipid synthase